MKFALAILISSVLFLSEGFGQVKVSGRVLDSGRNPLPGVHVTYLHSSFGTTTDARGNFTLPYKENGSLRFDLIGYNHVIVTLRNQGDIEVTMETGSSKRRNSSNSFRTLLKKIGAATVPLIVTFIDSTQNFGNGIITHNNSDSIFIVIPSYMLVSHFGDRIAHIRASEGNFQGLRIKELPSTEISNKEFAILRAETNEVSRPNDKIFATILSDKYFVLNSGRPFKLKTINANTVYQEIYLRSTRNSNYPIGTPVFNKFGIAGFLVDSRGSTLLAKMLPDILKTFARSQGDSSSVTFNNHIAYESKFKQYFSRMKLRANGFFLRPSIATNFYAGQDLKVTDSRFSPGFGILIGTNFSEAFDTGIEITYGLLRSKQFSSLLEYRQLNSNYVYSSINFDPLLLRLEGAAKKRLFALYLHSSIGASAIKTTLVNEAGHLVDLIQEIQAADDNIVLAYTYGIKMKYETRSPISIGMQLSILNFNTPYFDVDLNNLQNIGERNDKLVTLSFGMTIKLSE